LLAAKPRIEFVDANKRAAETTRSLKPRVLKTSKNKQQFETVFSVRKKKFFAF